MANDLEARAINVIRGLSMDAVQKANSGHPGTPMALAPLAHVLFPFAQRGRLPGRGGNVRQCFAAELTQFQIQQGGHNWGGPDPRDRTHLGCAENPRDCSRGRPASLRAWFDKKRAGRHVPPHRIKKRSMYQWRRRKKPITPTMTRRPSDQARRWCGSPVASKRLVRQTQMRMATIRATPMVARN